MPRTVSASEAKTRFGSIVNWAVESKDDVVVESYGSPKVVIMPYEEYQRVVQLREEARRREALAQLRDLREKIRACNKDLDQEGAQALAKEISEESVHRMMEEGKVGYEE